jgi:2-methylcitrate dehydratase PrpD
MRILAAIADVAAADAAPLQDAVAMAYHALLDILADGFLALADPACARLLGPVVPGATMIHGARVPGTSYELDPVMAAFNIGAMVRWVDFAAAGPASAWGQPADNLGAILALGDYLSRRSHHQGHVPLALRDLLAAWVMAHEMQCMLAADDGIENSGIDQSVLVRVASAASAARMLGAHRDQIADAVVDAWHDGAVTAGRRPGFGSPAAGPRRSRAAGDAAGRGVRLALAAFEVERGVPPPAAAPGGQPPGGPCGGRPGARFLESMRCRAGAQAAPGAKFARCVSAHFGPRQAARIEARFADAAVMLETPVHDCMAALVKNG